MENIIAKMQKEAKVPEYIAVYVDWYMRSGDKNRESWLDLVKYTTCPEFKGMTEKAAEKAWLTTDEAQNCIQIYMKATKTATMQKIYSEMVKKALAGDVRAASWVSGFHESEFFDTSQDDINEFLNSVNLPQFEKARKSKGRKANKVGGKS